MALRRHLILGPGFFLGLLLLSGTPAWAQG
jgi:hypothetical protein